MSSVCIPNCVDDARIPIRATYQNLYKWPKSEVEFMNTTVARSNLHRHGQPRGVNSISCRQLYLRSYTFSKKETMPERTRKFLDRVRKKVVARRRRKRKGVKVGRGRRRYVVALRKVKTVSWTVVSAIFQRLLSYNTSIDVETS
ncbi:uncharacterized protein LOC112521048 [Cynara cardunculus var. scolymus]|uniref:Uncharacterized protein n=1 Tax=Cynara cardunculus var. scolymus TaxID=59895 RepID=A0A103XGN7_CYNCS|nr:uncharacterized protein LOC112521048 [Cynara cardunculus var. scolymus]KVH90365.1 hypothetical protein Ccrd_007627 [Cynara cardunculus var. scolymus]